MKRKGYKEWTETYHSWKEYVNRNPNWNKYPSSRIAGTFAKQELDQNGICVAHYMQIPFDPIVHRDVCAFLKRIDEAEKRARKSKLIFRVGRKSLDYAIA